MKQACGHLSDVPTRSQVSSLTSQPAQFNTIAKLMAPILDKLPKGGLH